MERAKRSNAITSAAATAVATAVAVIGVTAVALAANQVKGGSYKGSIVPKATGILVKFKVSTDGKKVTGLAISSTPLYCSGGGPPTPVHFKNASISHAGTFQSTGQYVIKVGPFKGQVGTKLKITGKFAKHRREQGTLTTTYPNAPSCSGKTTYSTKA
jgi:hypothetical protein